MDEITIPVPDDWHLHLRDGDVLSDVVGFSAQRFARAIIMPNLVPPVTTVAMAHAYRDRILKACPSGTEFDPLMTLYLNDAVTPDEIDRASVDPHTYAVKLYPAGATTNSAAGVASMENVYPQLERMEATGFPLLVHGEVTDSEVDVFDREAVFIDRVLQPLTERFPKLKVVLEHITTEQGVAFVMSAPGAVAGTITAHHLLLNRNAIFEGGIRPHHYCLPILKRERHRRALVEAATGGSGRFFLGTDSAPHELSTKENACGCAGVFSSPGGIELYARAFDLAGRLDELEDFASRNGPAFYGLPVNERTMTLRRDDALMPEALRYGDGRIVPFMAGERLGWCVAPPAS